MWDEEKPFLCLRLYLLTRSLSQELFILWQLLGMKDTNHSDQPNRHTGRHTSVLLCLTETAFFTNWRSVATLHQASLTAPFSQCQLLTSCLSHTLVILAIFQTFSLVLLHLLCWSVINDLWCYYFNCFGVTQTAPI